MSTIEQYVENVIENLQLKGYEVKDYVIEGSKVKINYITSFGMSLTTEFSPEELGLI